MKNASQIINIIQSKPQFSKLSKVKCIKRIQSLFTPPVQKMINFAYFKQDTLFFVFNHPAGKQEFDNSIENIKSALKFHMPDECSDTTVSDIKAFVTHTPKIKQEAPKVVQQTYKERSSGEFEINIKNKELNDLVKSIRDIIKNNDTK
ncbi:hypothetical protein [Sulfurimonas sp.]|uniref:hypothetical protein n=1 Tax=Sulfurimonas sp. TaxID=2022749 RepID=UPI003564A458